MSRPGFAVVLLLLLFVPMRAADRNFDDLTAKLRAKIDKAAREHPDQPTKNQNLDTVGGAIGWLVSRMKLTPLEEQEAATRLTRSYLTDADRVEPGARSIVPKVFQRLLQALPKANKPFPYRLHLVKSQALHAFTLGGGQVFITTRMTHALNGSHNRREAAIAFLLAHEIGHIAREHCRRGFQLKHIQELLREEVSLKIDKVWLQKALKTGLAPTGYLIPFLYSREQELEADLFAFHLCRNAGWEEDAILDGIRWMILNHPRALTKPNEEKPSLLRYYLTKEPPLLLRLKQLLMEKDGQVESKKFGLFRYNRRSESFERCRARSLKDAEESMVLIHGMHGGTDSFEELLAARGMQRHLRSRSVLLLRYPNNGSLSRSARFLSNEVERTGLNARKAIFICHSAGGLVFRCYAEKLGGRFDRAVFLSTPHHGSSLTSLKAIADLREIIVDLKKFGILETMADILTEGNGYLIHDVQPESLFLDYLGEKPELRKRYYNHYGHYLQGKRGAILRATLKSAVPLSKVVLTRLVKKKARSELFLDSGIRAIRSIRLPKEILEGDLIVSTDSARLPGCQIDKEWKAHHSSIKTKKEVHKAILQVLDRD